MLKILYERFMGMPAHVRNMAIITIVLIACMIVDILDQILHNRGGRPR